MQGHGAPSRWDRHGGIARGASLAYRPSNYDQPVTHRARTYDNDVTRAVSDTVYHTVVLRCSPGEKCLKIYIPDTANRTVVLQEPLRRRQASCGPARTDFTGVFYAPFPEKVT
jgi:hypothetical protein